MLFLMMKINKPKHAITTDFHDFPFLPKPSISSMQHIFAALAGKCPFVKATWQRNTQFLGDWDWLTLLSRVICWLKAAAKSSSCQLQMQKHSVFLAHFATQSWGTNPKGNRVGKPGQMSNKVFRPEIWMNSVIQKVAVLVHMLAAVKLESYVK